MADEKEILAALLKALQQRSDEEEDKDLKTLFREVRDELRQLNGNTKESREARDEAKQIAELEKKYPALRAQRQGVTNFQTPAG